jgi:hypothetical protein
MQQYKRLLILASIADICLLTCLIYYFGVLKGAISFSFLCGIGAISGYLVRKRRVRRFEEKE